MNFIAKKIIGTLCLPLPIALILLLLGLLLLFFSHSKWFSKTLIVLAAITLIVFSTPYVPNLMLATLEDQYPPLTTIPKNINTIVVLGAGNGGYTHYPANDQLSSASLSRLIEGIRLQKLTQNSKIILSGGRVFGSPPDSTLMNNVATMLGVNPENIRVEPGSKDTYEEALYLKKIIGNNPFLLVTSAYHIPRAMALFEEEGMHPIAAPTQMLLGKNRYSLKNYFPNSIYLVYSDIAFHEYLGLWSSKLFQHSAT